MKTSGAEWVNINAKAKKIQNLEDKIRKIKENLRYERLPQKRAKISQRIHSLASKVSYMKCEETSKQEQQVVQKVRVDSKSFYKFARRLKPNNNIGPIKDGDQLLTGEKDIADVLQRQFLSVYPQPTEKIENVHEFCMSEIKEEDLNEIAINEQLVTEIIEELPSNSSPGDDGMGTKDIKIAKYGIAKPLAMIFTNSMDRFRGLEEPYLSKICPIAKPNKSKKDPSSYRPISLTSQIVKIMERIIARKILEHLEKQNMDDPQQYGFKKSKSAQQQLLKGLQYIIEHVEDGNVDTIYLDYARAFDKISHSHTSEN